MISDTIPKSTLISRLKQSYTYTFDNDNQIREMWQRSRNGLIDILLIEIACGDLDEKDEDVGSKKESGK